MVVTAPLFQPSFPFRRVLAAGDDDNRGPDAHAASVSGCTALVTRLRQNGGVSLFDAFGPSLFEDAEGDAPDDADSNERLMDTILIDEKLADGAQQSGAEVPSPPGWPEVEVRVSARRRKTSEARWGGGRIVVSLPAHLSGEAREKTIAWLVDRLVSKHPLRAAVGDRELMDRAIALSDRYRIGARPTSVRWVTNQSARWGSCSFHTGEIRLSHRLRSVPEWVLDAVLVHELAHLVYPNHSADFHKLANGYRRHHEAGLFLAGYGLGLAAPPS